MDLISRQDAIDAIETTTWYHQNKNLEMVSGANSKEHQAWYKAEDVYDAINGVPSANDTSEMAEDIAKIVINELDMRRWLTEGLKSERKKGKWINNQSIGLCQLGTCSVCGKLSIEADVSSFCPFCGADMRREEKQID